jgi:hypothetical protein
MGTPFLNCKWAKPNKKYRQPFFTQKIVWVLFSITETLQKFSALDAHPGWHPISSNANYFDTILTEDFENLMAYI